MIKELVVISGKGGTGKTSLVAAFAALAERKVVADCDVDAADLHLILKPTILRRESFRAGKTARIRPEDCTACGICREVCRFQAVESGEDGAGKVAFSIDPLSCEGCGVCAYFCPEKAIDLAEKFSGEWFVSETRFGPLVHAQLGIAEANSGKLVTLVRKQAREIAEQRGYELILIDGPPGIGCPVIASVTGASLVLAVTEPTVSGEHDLERVLFLARHFSIPTVVCVNKWDLNAGMTERIENKARQAGARVVGRIRYDRGVTLAQMQERAVVETEAPSARDVRRIWDQLGL
jgi:MinD superfamily P-loop ATPase